MPAGKTSYLDLDAVVPDDDITVKLGGVVHKLAPITLEDFVRNTKAVQNMGTNTDPETEMAMVSDMLFRAFPTMTPEMVGKLTLVQLNAILNFANEHNGAKKVDKEASAEAKSDPTPAGQ